MDAAGLRFWDPAMPCVGDITFLYSCPFWTVSEDFTAPAWLLQPLDVAESATMGPLIFFSEWASASLRRGPAPHSFPSQQAAKQFGFAVSIGLTLRGGVCGGGVCGRVVTGIGFQLCEMFHVPGA